MALLLRVLRKLKQDCGPVKGTYVFTGIMSTLGLAAANVASTHVPDNYSVSVTYPFWKNKPEDVLGSPMEMVGTCEKILLHNVVIFACSLVKCAPYGFLFPVTIADFMYEAVNDRHWRKYVNFGYTDSSTFHKVDKKINNIKWTL